MHDLAELIKRCQTFILTNLNDLHKTSIYELDKTGASIHVKNLQMIQLQKAIFLIGSISIYESMFQLALGCENGFKEVKNILKLKNKNDLLDQFEELVSIINVLKHGTGRSYDNLLNTASINIKKQEDFGFLEGKIDEILTLVHVNNELLENSSELMNKIWLIINS